MIAFASGPGEEQEEERSLPLAPGETPMTPGEAAAYLRQKWGRPFSSHALYTLRVRTGRPRPVIVKEGITLYSKAELDAVPVPERRGRWMKREQERREREQ